MSSLVLASIVWMSVSVALAADLAGSRERNYTSLGDDGCSCDAPGIVGLVCATRYRCREMTGLCVGGCASGLSDNVGCSCDAPGIVGLVCATPYRCREMTGLCVGGCASGLSDNVGCSCDAPGITGLVCATPYRCREMSGLCVGGC